MKKVVLLVLLIFLLGISAIASGQVNETTTTAPEECTDTDGGLDYYVKGTVVDKWNNQWTDLCGTGPGTWDTLFEYTCGPDNVYQMHEYVCPYGCEEGVCKEAPTTTSTTTVACTDNLDCPSQMKCENSVCVDVGCVEEGGSIPGAISPEYREHMATECCEGLSAIEYSGYYDENCNWIPLAGAPSGTCSRCGNGVCEGWETKCTCPGDCVELLCTDSDGGKNFYVKGTTSGKEWGGGEVTETDVCSSAQENGLLEKFCNEEGIVQTYLYICSYGCEDGACKKPTVICDGCLLEDGRCISVGERHHDYERKYTGSNDPPAYYCSGDKEILPQKPNGATCTYSYECYEYSCVNGICTAPGEVPPPEPPEGCAKYYTCPDGNVVRYCKFTSVYDQWGTLVGGSCGCVNPQLLCLSYKPPINVTRACAARIELTFSKETYYPGDYGKFVVEIFDSEGNPLPYYPFYLEASYAGGQQTPSLFRTDGEGRYVNTGRITETNVYMGKTFVRVFTEETETCAQVQDTAEIEFKRREWELSICGNGICEPGEGEICVPPPTAMICEQGESCEVPRPVCKLMCSQDCGQEAIFGNIGEEFKLKINQRIKFMEYKNLELKLNNIIFPRCVVPVEARGPTIPEPPPEYAGGITGTIIKSITGTISRIITGGIVTTETPEPTEEGTLSPVRIAREIEETEIEIVPVAEAEIPRCIGGPPYAVIIVRIGSAEGAFPLSLGEKKKIIGGGAIPAHFGTGEELALTFIDYDRDLNTGLFIVEKLPPIGVACPENCKCDYDGNIIECWSGETECPEGTILCPDGTCRESCKIGNITTECKFGCFYGEKCLPIGVRVKGKYCSIAGDLLPQIAKGECENNFECRTNLCIDDECIQRGLWRMIMEFFARFWRRGD